MTTLAEASAVFASEYRLRYVSDQEPGIRRLGQSGAFRYRGPDGEPVRDEATLGRIKRLAVPPAWSDVWICPRADGHIQATGRDARGRKQYRYHALWRQERDRSKYEQLVAFAEALPGVRARVRRDLRRAGLPRDKLLAAVVRLLEATLIRVGNEEYARANRSFGLTTLRTRHTKVRGAGIRFEFRGKSGVRHAVSLQDRTLAAIVKRLQELPGQELFQYIDEAGERHAVSSHDVNDYLREASGGDFTAKDFRTWAGTVLAVRALQAQEPAEPGSLGARKSVAEAIEDVARELGNTPAVCRKCYVHPAVIELYASGELGGALAKASRRKPLAGLSADEALVLNLLRNQQKQTRG